MHTRGASKPALYRQRAPTIQTTALPAGDLGVPYTAQLTATGGTGTYTWSVIDGSLPDGLTLSASGLVSGTPTAKGSASFTVRVADDAFAVHTRGFTIVVVTEIGEVAGTSCSVATSRTRTYA